MFVCITSRNVCAQSRDLIFSAALFPLSSCPTVHEIRTHFTFVQFWTKNKGKSYLCFEKTQFSNAINKQKQINFSLKS